MARGSEIAWSADGALDVLPGGRQPPAVLTRAPIFNKSPGELGTFHPNINAAATLAQAGTFTRLLELWTLDQQPASVLVGFRTEFRIDPLLGPLLGGPLTGRVEWGTGGGLNAVEFDVGSPRIPTQPGGLPVTGVDPWVQDYSTGVVVHVSGSSIRALVRNDGQIASRMDIEAGVLQRVGSPTPAFVYAFVGPGESQGYPLRRTIYLVGGVLAVPAPTVLAAGGFVRSYVPPFARRVRFFRRPIAQSLTVLTLNSFGFILRQQTIAAGSDGPMELTANEAVIQLENTGAAGITEMQAVFDLEVD